MLKSDQQWNMEKDLEDAKHLVHHRLGVSVIVSRWQSNTAEVSLQQ